MTISQHIGFIIAYIFLLVIAVGFAASFISVENKFSAKLDYVEDMVVVNRVVRCVSEDKEFGVISISKFSDETLSKCMGDKYLLNVKLYRLEGENLIIENYNLRPSRVVNRYVVVEGKAAKLEVSYNLA
ncbi:MAG: hypothetical protein AABX49_00305 [Nanoarchaeota archaeon]